MSVIRSNRRLGRVVATLVLALGLGGPLGLAALALLPAQASAETEEELLAKKAEWQDRYRVLRTNAVRMQDNAAKMRRAYGLAQHANYPRGNAREEFRKRVEKAESEAERYAAEAVEFQDEARRNQIPPGWLAEVEDEPIDRGDPAEIDPAAEDAEDREGRNPLYDDEEDENEEPGDDRRDGEDEDEESN